MMLRRGSTLVELMLSMSAGSVVMLLAISLVHQTMSVTEISKHRAEHNRTLDQLAQSFRSDVHLAAAAVGADANSLTLKYSDDSVTTYVVKDHAIHRQKTTGPHGNEFERFKMGETSTASFQIIPSPDRVLLLVRSETGVKDRPTKPDLVVESVVGRWKTLEQTSKVQP